MKIGFGGDHASVELKKFLIEHMESKGHVCVDYGTDTSESTNYSRYALKVGQAVRKGECEKGVLICGTGIGMSISANKVPGIRACACSDPLTAKLSVEHNNANIVAIGARIIGPEMAKAILDEFFAGEFQGGRHAGRVDSIAEIEKLYGAAWRE